MVVLKIYSMGVYFVAGLSSGHKFFQFYDDSKRKSWNRRCKKNVEKLWVAIRMKF